ncbi:type II toxin-antitoxin system PemK/MazF family toxin [Paenibacillus sp. JSM ZJ436]|uniref:type II toxin-antitoxin system PemK/MazF family toxin n=1 Tax=Paenibacillus sp. JSM ZJ436 TaxID=3376190 RepID=UPI0037AA4346
MPVYSDNRNFQRGEVFFVHFSGEHPLAGRPSRILRGDHRAVVMFDSTFPRNTVVVIPISSLYESSGEQKITISSDVIIRAADYPGMIDRDSFIMVNQIQSVTRSRLERLVGIVNPKDLTKIDIQLISTLSLSETIQQIIEHEVIKRLEELGVLEEEA